jgi:N-acetylmuramoyl-L-alanine amidase
MRKTALAICFLCLMGVSGPAGLVSGQTPGAQADYVVDHPRQGEGIYSMLRRNGLEVSARTVSKFVALNKSRVTGSNGLMRGVSYRLPSMVIDYPLLGRKYEKIRITGSELSGSVYYIISGHGGPDPGALGHRGKATLSEDEYAYDVSLRLARFLIENGATVYNLVQDDDGIRDDNILKSDQDERNLDGSAISRNKKKSLDQRTKEINRLYRKHRKDARNQRTIEIHVDSRPTGKEQIDVHFMYQSSAGRRLSEIIRDTLVEQYKRSQKNRVYRGKISKRDLYTLINARPVATYIELGNIQHRGDQIRITKAGNRQALAEWIGLGLIREAGSRSL